MPVFFKAQRKITINKSLVVILGARSSRSVRNKLRGQCQKRTNKFHKNFLENNACAINFFLKGTQTDDEAKNAYKKLDSLIC